MQQMRAQDMVCEPPSALLPFSACSFQLGSGDTKSPLGMEIVLIRSGEGLATPTRARFLVS